MSTATATPPLDYTEARKLISRTLTRLIIKQPWFASLALRLVIVEDDTIPTAYVDGVSLHYNPAWFAKLDKDPSLTKEFQEGVVAHEVMHCALLHMTRRGARDHSLWNQAGDHVINLELRAAGFKLPGDCLADPQYSGMSTDQVYAVLKQQQSQQGGGGGAQGEYVDPLGGVSDAPASSPGKPSTPDPNAQTPAPAPAPDPRTPSDIEREWKVATQQASMASRKAGKLPGGIDRATRSTLSSTDYSSIMARYLQFPGDYSWTRPNRRYISQGIYLPGSVPDRPGTVVFAVDTSGSVDATLLAMFAGECESILNSCGWPEHVYVLYCDTKVHGHEELDHAIEFHPKGGGGTLSNPVFEYVQRMGWDPTVLFYLTDLELGDSPREPLYPVVWVTPDHSRESAPFGELVRVAVSEE